MRIVVAGPCASGKTTLVEALKKAGYDASVVAQEHSIIRELYLHSQPDYVIGLVIDFPTLVARRGDGWTIELYGQELERLQEAFLHADLIIDGSHLDAATVQAIALNALELAVVTQSNLESST